MKRQQLKAMLSILLLASAFGCEDEFQVYDDDPESSDNLIIADDPEEDNSDLTAESLELSATAATETQRIINVKNGAAAYNRYIKDISWSEKECTQWELIDLEGGNQKVCMKWQDINKVRANQLHLSLNDYNNNKIFGAYTFTYPVSRCVEWIDTVPKSCIRWETSNVPDTTYQGCGLKAAQNALRYFGIALKQGEIGADVATHKITSSAIATYPGELRSGLAAILNQYGFSNIKVVRNAGSTSYAKMMASLKKGFPVIALTNNGGHWVVVSAYKQGKGFYVMDNWSNAWWSSVDLSFGGKEGFWSAITNTTYKENTIIYFDFV